MDETNTNGLDEAQFNAAELTLSKYKEEIEKEKEISRVLRSKKMELESDILNLKNKIEILEEKLKYAEQASRSTAQFKSEREEDEEPQVVYTPEANIKI